MRAVSVPGDFPARARQRPMATDDLAGGVPVAVGEHDLETVCVGAGPGSSGHRRRGTA